MNKEELRVVLEKFTQGNDFMLNPDEKHVDMLIEGLLFNKQKFGIKLCPCRVSAGVNDYNLSLVCPCNFKAQPSWIEKGMCWCGLFVKRVKE